jgi:hypothetical protein
MTPRIATLVLAVGLVVATSASAITIGYRPRTGDIWIDTHLTDMNRYGRTERDYFIEDVVTSFGAPRYFVRDLLVTRQWEPADVYYACALAHRLNRPCVDVVRDYGDDRGQGWGVIAQRMGIKPGSAEFHALKGDLGRVDERYRKRHNKSAHSTVPGDGHGNSGHGNSGHVDKGPGNSGKPDKGSHGKPDKGGQGKPDKGGKGHGH